MRAFFLAPLAFVLLGQALAADPYRIEVVEKGSSWPVPLVELRTTNDVRFVTDNAGVVAFDLPEFMGRETWLSVSSPNYEVPADGLGSRGFRCTPTPGGKYRLEIPRVGIARRLGRLTGSGLFAESQKLGERMDWKESGVTGQDTAMLATYHNRLFWTWGDTGVPGYALGIFHTAAATTPIRPLASFQPPVTPPYEYFRRPDGRPRNTVDVQGSGPAWVSGVVSLPDKEGREHLVCHYQRIENHLDPTETGLAEWDDKDDFFRPKTVLWRKSDGATRPLQPTGHTAFWQDAVGKRWLYAGEGLPNFRCPATYEAWNDRATWEKVERPAFLLSAKDEEKVTVATGSVAWNPWRKRWVTVLQQKFGKPSGFGEIWYAEGDSPTGPWGKAVKVLSHKNYTLYNVLLHPELTPADSPVLLFEGTYTVEFADKPAPTARYNYNQLLYRLDLDDPALAPTQAK